MMAMSFTRFLAIVFPVQNLKLATERKARAVCICIWIFTCAVSSPFLMSGQTSAGNKTKCFEPPKGKGGVGKLMALNYFSLVVGFIIPFLVIMLCYAGITRALLGRASASGSQQKQRSTRIKAIRMIVIVTVTFLVSFMPYHVQRTVHLHFMQRQARSAVTCDELVIMQKSVVVTLCLAASNSCFDPLLYFFSGENFRNRLSTFRRPSGGVLNSGPRRRTLASEALKGPEQNEREKQEKQVCNGPDNNA